MVAKSFMFNCGRDLKNAGDRIGRVEGFGWLAILLRRIGLKIKDCAWQ